MSELAAAGWRLEGSETLKTKSETIVKNLSDSAELGVLINNKEILMKAKLMSYNQIDFQSKAHMKSMIKDIEEQVEKYGSQMKKAGLVSFVLTQIWNKQGKFRLGSHFSYRDEKAFVACQKILNGIPQDEDNPTVTNADRGIVLLTFGDEQ